MKTSYKFIGSVIMMAALAACGGGDGDSGSNGNSKPDDTSKPPVEEPSSKLTSFMYYSRDHDSSREVKLDAEASSATITLGSDTISYTYDAANNSFSGTGGYSMIGGLGGDNPGAQVCQEMPQTKAIESIHILLPANAAVAKRQDLIGKTFTWYEDCRAGTGTADDPIPASVTFNSDGSLSIQESGKTEIISAAQVDALLSESGFTEGSTVSHLFPFQIGNQITIVQRSRDSVAKENHIAALSYEP